MLQAAHTRATAGLPMPAPPRCRRAPAATRQQMLVQPQAQRFSGTLPRQNA